MNKINMATIRDEIAKALAAQVRRTLDVSRLRGWAFPTECDVAVTVLDATSLAVRIKARMDDITAEADITPERATADVAVAAGMLVVQWLAKHATAKPKRAP